MATLSKVEDRGYIQFLIAAQTAFSCNEAGRCSGAPDTTPAHDPFTRLLTRRPPDTETLWQEVEPFVDKASGLLINDDSTHFDEADHWATNDLSMTEAKRQELARQALAIENYHRALKQCCAVEKCQARSAVAQKNHILFSLRAFVHLEVARLRTGKSCYETKLTIIREAVRSYCRSGDLLRATSA